MILWHTAITFNITSKLNVPNKVYIKMCSLYNRHIFLLQWFFKGGWLKVEWDMNSTTVYHYRYGSNHNENDKYDVKVCNEPRLLENQLIETRCLVTRGMIWTLY